MCGTALPSVTLVYEPAVAIAPNRHCRRMMPCCQRPGIVGSVTSDMRAEEEENCFITLNSQLIIPVQLDERDVLNVVGGWRCV